VAARYAGCGCFFGFLSLLLLLRFFLGCGSRVTASRFVDECHHSFISKVTNLFVLIFFDSLSVLNSWCACFSPRQIFFSDPGRHASSPFFPCSLSLAERACLPLPDSCAIVCFGRHRLCVSTRPLSVVEVLGSISFFSSAGLFSITELSLTSFFFSSVLAVWGWVMRRKKFERFHHHDLIFASGSGVEVSRWARSVLPFNGHPVCFRPSFFTFSQ